MIRGWIPLGLLCYCHVAKHRLATVLEGTRRLHTSPIDPIYQRTYGNASRKWREGREL